MKIVTNEIVILQQILLHNEIDMLNPLNSIRVLAKYLYQYGYDKGKVQAILQQYISQQEPPLDPLIWNRRLENTVAYTFKHAPKLIYIDSVIVTDAELQQISALNNDNREKLAFAYLIHSKVNNKRYDNQHYEVYTPTTDIVKEAQCNKPVRPPSTKRTLTKVIRRENPLLVISDLVHAGYLEQTRSIGKNTKKTVLFANEESDTVMTINDFDHYMNYYLQWRYKTLTRCQICTSWVRTTVSQTRYCTACRKEKEKEAKRDAWHRNKERYAR